MDLSATEQLSANKTDFAFNVDDGVFVTDSRVLSVDYLLPKERIHEILFSWNDFKGIYSKYIGLGYWGIITVFWLLIMMRGLDDLAELTQIC